MNLDSPLVDDDDEFTELYGAKVERVDLVDAAANGHRFVLAKSAGGGMMPADAVRRLLKGERPMIRKAKAGPQQVAAYDAKGNLVGTVDPADIHPVGDAGAQQPAARQPTPEQAERDANAQRVVDNMQSNWSGG